MTRLLPTLSGAKAEAKALRASKAVEGVALSHSASLELIAQSYGFRDWNTCKSKLPELAQGLAVGARVRGRYLSQPFDATVVRSLERTKGWTAVALDFDVPVDVVRFDSFSNLRKRVSAVIGPNGHTREHTSDGVPQLILDLI